MRMSQSGRAGTRILQPSAVVGVVGEDVYADVVGAGVKVLLEAGADQQRGEVAARVDCFVGLVGRPGTVGGCGGSFGGVAREGHRHGREPHQRTVADFLAIHRSGIFPRRETARNNPVGVRCYAPAPNRIGMAASFPPSSKMTKIWSRAPRLAG